MGFRFFENTINNHIGTIPNEDYRDAQQAFVSMEWDNTTAKYCIQEQDSIGSSSYHDIEVWITPTVAETSTGLKDPLDFNKIVFEDINHITTRGLMYKFDNNYWIVHSYAPYNGVVQDCGIRRCNNALRVVDPITGNVYSQPCIVEYDMAASTVKVNRHELIPDNHAIVITQGNDMAHRLFKTNTRFILSGRPFKLYGYQNAVELDLDNPTSTLLYLDLYLDEIRDGDNLLTSIADNGEFDYAVSINSENLTLPQNTTGTLTANVTLNGNEVTRNIIWTSSNANVTIKANGEYKVMSAAGGKATITACLEGNKDVFDTIEITVGTTGSDIKIITNPLFDTIKQYQQLPFSVEVYYNGALVNGATITCTTNSPYMTITNTATGFILNGVGVSTTTQYITITAIKASPAISKTITLPVKASSMF